MRTGQYYNGLPVDEVLDKGQNYVGKATAYDKPMRNGIHSKSKIK